MSPALESPTLSPSTEDLLLRCRSGAGDGEAALRELIHRYLPLVHGAARRRTDSEALAEDVAQAVFCDLARQVKSLPPRIQLGGWLWRHTGFLVSRALRSERRRAARETEAARLAAPPSSAMTTPVNDLLPALDEALHRLPEREQALLIMRYYEEREVADIAGTLGISPAAAQKRTERALDRLRRLLPRERAALTVPALAALLSPGTADAALPASLTARVEAGALAAAAHPSPGLLVWARHMSPLTGGLLGAAAALAAGGAPLAFWNTSAPPPAARISAVLVSETESSPPKPPAPNATDLVAEIVSLFDREGLNKVAYRKAEILLDSIPSSECGEAVVMLSQAYPGKGLRTNLTGLDRLTGLLLWRWTPESPAAGLLSILPRVREEDRHKVTIQLTHDWFRKEPAAATGWWRAMLTNPDMTSLSPELRKFVLSRMAEVVVMDLARRDRPGAEASTAEMDRQEIRPIGNSTTAGSLLTHSYDSSLASYALEHSSAPHHEQVKAVWESQEPPAKKLAAAERIEDPALRRDLAVLLGTRMLWEGAIAGAEAAHTADWILARIPPEDETSLRANLTEGWGGRDRDAFEAWAGKHWPDKARSLIDLGAMKRLEGTAVMPEQVAASVVGVRDEDLRAYALARQTAKAMDQPAAASRVLESGSLSEESAASLRQLFRLPP